MGTGGHSPRVALVRNNQLMAGNLLPQCELSLAGTLRSHQLGQSAYAQPGSSDALSLAQGSPVVRAKEAAHHQLPTCLLAAGRATTLTSLQKEYLQVSHCRRALKGCEAPSTLVGTLEVFHKWCFPSLPSPSLFKRCTGSLLSTTRGKERQNGRIRMEEASRSSVR